MNVHAFGEINSYGVPDAVTGIALSTLVLPARDDES
jgi:hypothetical protein